MRRIKKLGEVTELWLLGLIILLCIAISSRSTVFFTIGNFKDVFMINSVLGVTALGMTLCIITGGIDVSIAGNLAISLTVAGNLVSYAGMNIWPAMLICIVCCGIVGALNGLLISYCGIPPIVATLGMLSVINGSILLITKGAWINTSSFPRDFMAFSRSTVLGIPIQIAAWFVVIVLGFVIMNYTMIGRSIYAVGGNRISAERAGVNVKRVLMFVYTYNGLLCGLAGVLYLTIVQQVDSTTFTGYEMTVLSAVVVGGTSMAGGIGSIPGTILGVIFITLTNNGLVLARIPTFWQRIVVGVVILSAVTFDVIRRKNTEKRLPKIDVMQ